MRRLMLRLLAAVTRLLDRPICRARIEKGWRGAEHRCMSTVLDHGDRHVCACGSSWPV